MADRPNLQPSRSKIDTVYNPETGRQIKVGGRVYTDLVRKGIIPPAVPRGVSPFQSGLQPLPQAQTPSFGPSVSSRPSRVPLPKSTAVRVTRRAIPQKRDGGAVRAHRDGSRNTTRGDAGAAAPQKPTAHPGTSSLRVEQKVSPRRRNIAGSPSTRGVEAYSATYSSSARKASPQRSVVGSSPCRGGVSGATSSARKASPRCSVVGSSPCRGDVSGVATSSVALPRAPKWTQNQTLFYGPDVYSFNVQAAQPLSYDFPPEFTENLRSDLLTWMLEFAEYFYPDHPVWPQAVTYVDVFLATIDAKRDKALALGIAAVRLAECLVGDTSYNIDELSYEAFAVLNTPPTTQKVLAGTETVKKIERDLAEVLQYNFRIPTVYDFLTYFRPYAELDDGIFAQCRLISELALTKVAFLAFHPALVSAAAVVMLKPDITNRMVELSTFSAGDVDECAVELGIYLDELESSPTPLSKNLATSHGVALTALKRAEPRLRIEHLRGSSGRRTPTPEKSPLAGIAATCGSGGSCTMLGEGTYGKVYEIGLESKTYAVKKYDPGTTTGLLNDFVVETSALTAFNSGYAVPGTSPGYVIAASPTDIGFTNDIPFVAMERCETSLNKLIGGWPPIRTAAIMETIRLYTEQILRGLAYIHAMGLIHCDIKPGNVLVCGGVAKLADFGLARWEVPPGTAKEGEIFTITYRPPEHLLGGKVAKPSSDLWAFGCSVFEMANGRPPFGISKPLPKIFASLGRPQGRAWTFFHELAVASKTDLNAFAFEVTEPFPLPGAGAFVNKVISETLRYLPDERVPAKILLF